MMQPTATPVMERGPGPAEAPHGASSFPAWTGGLSTGAVSLAFTRLVPSLFARDHLVLSQGADESGAERLVFGAEPDPCVAHNLAVRLGCACSLWRADPENLAAIIDQWAAATETRARHRDASPEPADPAATTGSVGQGEVAGFAAITDRDLQEAIESDDRDLLRSSGRAPIVRLVNGVLFEALQRRASDVHVHPVDRRLSIRFRIDGVLQEVRSVPRKLLEPVVTRIKVMAKLDVAERRLPQDGRSSVRVGAHAVDLRVSCIPTAQGERVVIRLLDTRSIGEFTLAHLGMPPEIERVFHTLCERPHGMVLVTGPTGSGKTTTLYAALRRMDGAALNIMTLEDPIEYELPGISQSQVNHRKGLTFAGGLRHLLRQDPDVIMVGEIRDAETARVAMQAALTGHMVLSTLHTNDAPSAVTRLLDLGVESYLINAALTAVLAQRLVRESCASCRHGMKPEPSDACERCFGTGFRGRTGLFELLIMDERIRSLVAARAGTSALRDAARSGLRPMRTLREAGASAAAAGLTTAAEVDRVILLDEEGSTPG